MDWDDVRYFLALHRQGTLSHAARDLGVNHATVGRRVAALEATVGASLFHKTPDGFLLTAVGESMLEAALGAEAAMLAVERALRGADDSLRGEVRISTSQLLSHALVVPAAAELRELYPEIEIDAIEATRFSDLARQEADIAVRMQLGGGVAAAGDVRVRLVGKLPWALYASSALAERLGPDAGTPRGPELPVILYDDHAPGKVGERWVTEAGVPTRTVMKSSSMYTVRAAVAAAIGAGFLPRAWAEAESLVALTEPVHHSSVLVALHPDVAQNARIRVVFDHLVDYAQRHPEVFA